ncbi:hypothetical protein ABPG72_021478 [Tetrahymena utriculariae]
MTDHEQPYLILFVIMGLALGGLLRQLNRKTGIPYTPMLIVVGIIVGCYRSSFGLIGSSAELMSHINPHMILFIFIPVLIFESGFNCDWYVFKRALVNIIILAAPGVLVGAFMLGFCLKSILGYDDDLTWNGAFTMGAILCATDPVAVVALLKELGASVRFNTLIEGESLLNDGTAMVFFLVFFGMEKGEESTPISVTLNFIRLAGGGPALGFICGMVGSFWLRRIIRDDVLTSTITFITCYFCFYFAEFTFLGVSGILSIVVLGLFMSAHGRTKIYPESEHSVHTVWSFVQYSCETIIFLLTGVIVGKEMVSQSTIEFMDWVKLPMFWILMMIARALMVFMFLPFLKYFGYGINRAEMWVLIWGGLRGALGLTLALIVAVDTDLQDEVRFPLGRRLRQLTIFYMSGVATMTLLINGTTCGALVRYLQMIEVPQIRARVVKNSKRNLSNACDDKLKELKMNTFLNLADWEKVIEISGCSEIKNELVSGADGQVSGRRSTYSSFDEQEICSETRFRLLRTLKTYVWEGYEQGQMGPEAAQLLNECINVSLDNTNLPLIVWNNIYSNFTDFATIRLMFRLKNWFLIGTMAKNYITHHMAFVYEVTTAFITSAEEAEHLLHNYPLGQQFISKIVNELKNQVNDAYKYISELQNKFPEIIKAIHTKRAASALLETQKKFLNEYKNNGYIDDGDYNDIRKKVDLRCLELENMTFNWQDVSELQSFNTFVLRFPIFSSLLPEEIRQLEKCHKSFNFYAGNEIYHEGQKFDYLYVITQGTVTDALSASDKSQYTMIKGMGAFLSFANCVNENNSRSVSTAIAETDCTLYGIPFATIKGIMSQNKTFEKKVYLYSMIYFVRIFPEKTGPLRGMEENHLNEYIVKSEFLALNARQSCTFEYGGYLLVGQIENAESGQDNIIDEFSYIPPSNRTYITSKNSYILKFTEVLERKQSIMDAHFEEQGVKKFNQNLVSNSNQYVVDEQQL